MDVKKNDHTRSSEVGDLICPPMTMDDLDTWRVIYSAFVGANFESDLIAMHSSLILSNRSAERDSLLRH